MNVWYIDLRYDSSPALARPKRLQEDWYTPQNAKNQRADGRSNQRPSLAKPKRKLGRSDETTPRHRRQLRCGGITLILTADPSEELADKLYGTFGGGTISTVSGVPQIHFHREAGSLEEAIRSAIGDAQAIGFAVERVEMEPAAVLQAS